MHRDRLFVYPLSRSTCFPLQKCQIKYFAGWVWFTIPKRLLKNDLKEIWRELKRTIHHICMPPTSLVRRIKAMMRAQIKSFMIQNTLRCGCGWHDCECRDSTNQENIFHRGGGALSQCHKFLWHGRCLLGRWTLRSRFRTEFHRIQTENRWPPSSKSGKRNAECFKLERWWFFLLRNRAVTSKDLEDDFYHLSTLPSHIQLKIRKKQKYFNFMQNKLCRLLLLEKLTRRFFFAVFFINFPLSFDDRTINLLIRNWQTFIVTAKINN